MHTYLGIETHFVPATNIRPARISASCDNCDKRHRVEWLDSLGAVENHARAAQAHANYHAERDRTLGGAHAYTIEATIGDAIGVRRGYVFALHVHRELRPGFRAA